MPVNSTQELRYYILEILNYSLPTGCGMKVMSISLDGIRMTAAESEIEVQLGYLGEKGYITYEEITDRHTKISRKIAKLTAKGIDLIEGNIPADPGIGLTPDH